MPSINLRGARVELFERGAGEPVILLHCSASSGEQWRSLAERLADRYRVLAPDLWGYGGTDMWRGGDFSLSSEAEIVLAMLHRAGGRAHLVGHSYGGAVALRVALRHAPAVKSLALIEPVALHLLREEHYVDQAALAEISVAADRVKDALARGERERGMREFVDYWSGEGAWGALAEAKRAALLPRLEKVVLDFHAAFEDPARVQDFWPLFMPTLLLQGGRSPLPPRRICSQLSRVLPESRLAIVEGAGHMLPLTHAERVNELVAAHLDAARREQSFQYAAA